MNKKLIALVIGMVLLAGGFFFFAHEKQDEYQYEITDTVQDKLLDNGYREYLREVDSVRIEYDNYYKSYDASEKIITVEDFEYEIVTELKLLSDYEERVSPGMDVKVAEFLLIDYQGEYLFDSLEFFNMKSNYEPKIKQFKLKYATDYLEEICYDIENNITNETEEICYNQTQTNWTEFVLLSEIPSKNIRVGIFTDTVLGENVEWVPTIRGVECLEWASYLVTDLVSYYKLDENAANTIVIDSTASTNATATTNTNNLYDVDAKIGSSFEFDGSSERVSRVIGSIPTGNNARTFNFWFKANSLGGANTNPMLSYGAFSTAQLNTIDINDGGSGQKLRFWGHGRDLFGTTTISTGTWYMATITHDGTTTRVYLNGINEGNATQTLNTGSSTTYLATMQVTVVNYFDGLIDEVGVWSKALNQSAITDLYNSGSGLAYPFEEEDTEYPIFSNYWDNNASLLDSGTGIFNVTINSTNGTVLLEINNTNITAINLTSNIYNASYNFTLGGTYPHKWHSWGNGTNENYNVSATQSYTVNETAAIPPNVTALTEYPFDPTTYSQTTIYQFNATVIDDGTIDDVILEFNGANSTATNTSADIFYVNLNNLSAGVYNYRWFANDTVSNINNTETGSYTINKAIPEGALTSTLGWTINETQEVTIGLSESQVGDDDVTYIVNRDNVEKGTGETWSPPYGTYSYVLNTTGGVNWSENISMDIKTLTVSDNINPSITIDYPVNSSSYNAVVTELNYTTSDTNINTCWYSLNNGSTNQTITCGDNATGLNSGQGWSTWQVWVNDSDSNINTTTTTFFVDTTNPTYSLNQTDNTEAGQSTVFSILWDDDTALNPNGQYIFSTNNTGVWVNDSAINFTATPSWANVTKVLNSTGGLVIDYRWYVTDNAGNVNDTGLFSLTTTVTDTTSPNITTLVEYPSDPATYSQTTNYQFNATVIDDGTIDDVILEFNGINYTATNTSADIFYINLNNLSAGVYNYRWFANDTVSNINNSETGSYTVNKAIPEGTLTSTLGWTINETQEVTIGLTESQVGDGDVTYIVNRDNVEKGTGETWSPSYGTYSYVLNTTGGVNWSENISMDIKTLTVNDNINPSIIIDYPVDSSSYNVVVTELNYTASDTNINTCWYSLNNGTDNQTVTCGDDVTGLNSGQGWSTWQVWVNDSDNNINTTTTTFFVESLNPTYSLNQTDNTEAGQSTVFSILWDDDTALNPNGQYIFSTNNTGVWVNDSAINFTATPSWANVTKVLNSTGGLVIDYRWYVTDNAGNVNDTGLFSLTITEATAIDIETIYPTTDINVTQNEFFNVTVNVTCRNGNCEAINVSLNSEIPAGQIYQENANITIDNGLWASVGNVTDGDWGTYGVDVAGGDASIIYMNYSVPSGALNTSKWRFKYDDYPGSSTDNNYSIPSGCWDETMLQFRIRSVKVTNSFGYFACYNYTDSSWVDIYDGGSNTYSGNIYEEAMWWEMSTSSSRLVNTTIGATPFYTNESNPRNITLNKDESQLVTFWVNATGEGNINYTFFAYVNQTSNLSVSNITSTWLVEIVTLDISPPNITALTEYPSDPATYSQTTNYQFNATVIDGRVIDDVILEFNGTNYTATNTSADIFYVSLNNLSAGVYNYRWFANDTVNNINNSETGSYTVSQMTSQTSLTFDVASPQTYGTAITPTCSATGGIGEVVLEMDGNVITSGAAITLGADTYSFNCSLTETQNYTGSTNVSDYTIDKDIPWGSLTSTLGWAINESQEITIGLSEAQTNDGDVSYIVHRDHVPKGTGETWYPPYGVYNYLLNTTGGANWTANDSMNTQTLIVNDTINPNIKIVFPVNNTEYKLTVTELNYTVNDTNIDECWYSLNGGLTNDSVLCGDNVDGLNSGQGFSTWQAWAMDVDGNINTTSVTFFVDSNGPNITTLVEYPSDPATYSQTTIYQFNATVIDDGTIDDVILEFNGTNYTATNTSADIFYVSLNNLSAGVYNYRWFANDTTSNMNNTEIGSYTVSQAVPNLILNGTTPIIYGAATDFSGAGCPTQLTCSLDINNTVYGAGDILANYSTAGNINYTSAYVNFTITINKATLVGSITGNSSINYTAIANITANETNNNDSDVIYILYRDNTVVSNPDNTVLGVGSYFYIYNSTGGQNYSSNNDIAHFTLDVGKIAGEVYAYVGNLRADYIGDELTAQNEYLNGTLNVGLGNIKMYFNNSLIGSGPSPLFDVRDFPIGSYYFNVTYDGDNNYTSAEEHWGINVSAWQLSNLTGVFNLNAESGYVAYDISGNSNNGTIDEADWDGDEIEVILIDGFDYSVDDNNGSFSLLNDAWDMTFIEIDYIYFTYGDDALAAIVTKILPGLLIMLVLIMIFKLFMLRRAPVMEEYIYGY